MSNAAPDKSDAADKRAKARAAMEGERHKAARDLADKSLAERRQEAQRAMEGGKHKSAREAKERAKKEQEESKLKLIEDLEKQREEVRAEEEAKRLAERTAEEKLWQEKNERLTKAKESKSEIEKLTKEQKVNLSPIRTFKADLAELAKTDAVSVEKIIIQEKERARDRLRSAPIIKTDSNFNWRRATTILGVVILLALIGAGAYLMWPTNNPANNIQPLTVPSIITPSERREINVTGLSPERLIAALERQHELIPVPEEAVTQFYFIEGDAGSRKLLNFFEIANKLVMDLPLSFTQSINSNFMMGLYRSREPAGFYLFGTDNADALRAAMINNERKVVAELYRPFAGRNAVPQVETAKIRDAILSNVDVRIFEDMRGKTIFVWGLVSDNLLIITENESAFNKIFKAYRP